MRQALLALFLIALTVAAAPPPKYAATEVMEPRQPGPYPVGVTTTVFVDPSRTDAATKESRTLVTEIWYPATDDAKSLPKNKFTDFIPGGLTPQFESLLKLAYKKTSAEIN